MRRTIFTDRQRRHGHIGTVLGPIQQYYKVIARYEELPGWRVLIFGLAAFMTLKRRMR
jgi:hypothetical protein